LKTLLAPLTQEKERHERRNMEGEEIKGHNIGRHDNELWSLPMLFIGEKRKTIKNIDKKENNKVENKKGRRGNEKRKLILREVIGVIA